MRKSVRPYLNGSDISSGRCSDSFRCAVKVCVDRLGLLPGKCFGVVREGIFVGPNKKTVNSWINQDKTPQILFSKQTQKWIEDFDFGRRVEPTHITLIDPTGAYL